MVTHRMILNTGLLISLLGWLSVSSAFTHTPWTEELYRYIEEKYGSVVTNRGRELQSMILREAVRPIEEELAQVNAFFNQVQWVSDSLHWGKKDYWQTPFETLVEFRGDCEDIAIAKYTALRVMGIPDEQLALVYGKVKGVAHMVLAHYTSADADPLVLDSLHDTIMRASKREDLVPIYEFNSTTLWLTDPHMHKLGKGKPEHLALEDEFKQRLVQNRHVLKSHNGGKPVVPFTLTDL